MKTTRNPQIRRRNSGFTLLEMVIVLGIIAMILGGAIFAMKGITGQAKISQTNADFKSIQNSLDMYKLIGGTYPSTSQGLKALVEKPTSAPKPSKWSKAMNAEPLDPWKNPYGYKFPGKKNPAEPEIISKGPDGIEGNEDDLSSQDD